MLKKLLKRLKIREQDIIDSISVDFAFKKDVCRENEAKYLLSLTPMVTENVSEDIAKKITGSGLFSPSVHCIQTR